jgi:hypothetical protein
MMVSRTLVAILNLGLLISGPVIAGEITSTAWTSTEFRSGDNDNKKAKDISGISCTEHRSFPRRCLVVDDNSQSAQAAMMTDGRLKGLSMVKLIDNVFGLEKLELDGEGVAFDGKLFYVIGSHGHPRDKKKNWTLRTTRLS